MFVFVPVKSLICFSHFSFALFHNVRVPRENLLNKTGDITSDGRYVSPFKVSKMSKWTTSCNIFSYDVRETGLFCKLFDLSEKKFPLRQQLLSQELCYARCTRRNPFAFISNKQRDFNYSLSVILTGRNT